MTTPRNLFRCLLGSTGLKCYEVRIPGSNVTAYIGQWENKPDEWAYSLWTEDDEIVAGNTITIPSGTLTITAEQVARIAFLLEVEYNTNED